MQPPPSGFWYSGIGGNSGSDGSSPLPSQLNPGYARNDPAQDAGSFSGRQDFYSTTTNMDELDFLNRGGDSGPEERFYGGYAPGNNYGGGAAGSESYAASAYYAAAPAGNDYGSDGGYAKGEPVETQAEDPIAEIEDLANIYSSGAAEAARNREPVLSDVSDLEPVYSFSSRSRYLGGRAVFSQTRYTPGEPGALPPMPMSRARRPSMQSRPADPAAKGGV